MLVVDAGSWWWWMVVVDGGGCWWVVVDGGGWWWVVGGGKWEVGNRFSLCRPFDFKGMDLNRSWGRLSQLGLFWASPRGEVKCSQNDRTCPGVQADSQGAPKLGPPLKQNTAPSHHGGTLFSRDLGKFRVATETSISGEGSYSGISGGPMLIWGVLPCELTRSFWSTTGLGRSGHTPE